MIIFQIVIILIFIIVVLLFTLSLINQMVYKVPHVSTFNEDLYIVKEAFNTYHLEWKKVADLWSWTWKILRLLDKEFKAEATWYEIDISNVIISKILNKVLSSKATVIKWDYLQADLQKYEVLYIYLFPCLMKKVEERIFSHCKKGTIIIVNAFQFKNHTPSKIFYKKWKEKIFVYKI